MDIAELQAGVDAFRARLEAARQSLAEHGIPWYPFGTLHNVWLLDRLLSGEHRDLGALIGDRPVLDIGAADGELAFFLESQGWSVDVIDHPPTNYNGCRGLALLREALGSSIGVYLTDFDRTMALPERDYGFAFVLGILYHLKNPFGVLEALAQRCRHVALSTRVVRYDRPKDAPGPRLPLREAPVAYLVSPTECNGDATNYWMFSEAGLRRLVDRAGWDVLEWMTVGDTVDSDPASVDGDERCFCLLRSRWQ